MSEIEYSNYRWVVLGTLCVVQAATVAVLVAPATLIADIAGEMGLSLGLATGAAMVFHNVFLVVSAIFGGTLIDRFGPYRVWTGGMVLVILSLTLVPVFGGTLPGMLFIRALHGIAAGPIMATSPVVVAQWSPLKQRGVILGIQGTFVSIGAAFSMLIVPIVFEKSGNWQFAISGAGVLSVVALILSLVVVCGPRPAAPATAGVQSTGHIDPGNSQSVGRYYLMPSTWAAAFCGFWFSWAVRMVYDIIPSYLAMEAPAGVGMGLLKAGRTMAMVHIVSMIGAISSGMLMEKYFGGRPRGLVMIGFLLSAALWLPMGFPDFFSSPLVISLCLWAGAAAISLTLSLVLTFVSKYYPEQMMGKISGLVTGASTFGTLTGLAAGASALHLTGRYHVTILFICAGAFLGFLSSAFLKTPAGD